MTDIASIITELEQRRTAIETALEALRGVSGATSANRGPGRPKGRSSDGRHRQAEAMRRYWAERKASGKATKTPAKKRGLTAAGRKALSENMKRMWAEKKLGKKRTGR